MRHKRTTTRQLQRLSTMRAAKERKRLRAADEFEPCGCVVFIGPMFGGAHVIRCKARHPGEPMRVEIDGEAHKLRTLRGLRAVIARRVWRA